MYVVCKKERMRLNNAMRQMSFDDQRYDGKEQEQQQSSVEYIYTSALERRRRSSRKAPRWGTDWFGEILKYNHGPNARRIQ